MEYCHAPIAECFHWNLPTSWIVWIRRLAFLPFKIYNKHHSLTKPVILITSWEPGMLPLLCIKQTERIIINCFCKYHGPLARYIKIAGAHAPGMSGTFYPSLRISNSDMKHGTCVTHVPWCMPGSLSSDFLCGRRRRKTFPAFPAHACATRNFT